MAWVGGKKALREEVLARFPLYYERYIEVFGGGGWVLFHKPPGTDFEVYNDLNGNLAALYRAVRDHPRELQERLRYADAGSLLASSKVAFSITDCTLPLRNNGKSYFTDTRAQFIPLHGVLFQ